MRFQLLSMMNSAMASSGATVQRTSSRLNCSERHIRRVLAGKTELSLREVAEMFWAIDGLMVDFSMAPKPGRSA